MIVLKRNDTAITFRDVLEWTDGPQTDLTGCSVRFLMSNETNKSVAGIATILNAAAREVSYTVGCHDLSVAGTFRQEWEITFPSGKILTVPSAGYHSIKIIPDLG